MKTKLERTTEKSFTQFCVSLGIACPKLRLATESAWPDRTLLYKGQAMFLELKRGGERPTPLQMHQLDTLTRFGFNARWSDDFEQMKAIVLAWKQYVDDQQMG